MVNFWRRPGLGLVLASGLALASCGGGGGDIDNELAFRVIHAAPDAPPVNILVDDTVIAANAPYKTGTGLIFVTPRTYKFEVQAVLPGEDVTLFSESVSLAAGAEYTVIAIGKSADRTVQSLIIENTTAEVPANNARLQLLHAAPDAPEVDIYVTEPDASLTASTPAARLAYGDEATDRLLFPSGDYQVRVTPAGDPDTVLFDTGEITLRNRDDLLVLAVASTAPGDAPISLLVSDRFTTAEVLDKDTPTAVRVVHASPDAPALDVIGARPEPPEPDPPLPEVTFADDLTYLQFTPYVFAEPDTWTVRGVESSEPEPETAPFSFTRELGIGQRTTVLAVGLLENIDDLVLADEIRPIYTEGRIRIVNLALGSGVVDVYVAEAGTDISTVAPTLPGVGVGIATAHLGFTPDNYTVSFTLPGTKTVLASQAVPATESTVHTVILVDEVRVDEESDGKPPGVLLLDDLAS